ncbi:MAG: branched-chain amino acid ABC transporter permease [Thermodesulfobacteriota bacterium]
MTNLILAQTFNGLVLGMIYVLLAMGLSIVWGMMDIINFAHGLFFGLGAYLAYTVAAATGSFWLCLIIVPLITALIGVMLETVLLRRLYGQNILYQILMTYGIALAGRELIILIYGPVGKSFDQPALLTGVISIAGFFFPIYRVFVFVLALFLTAAMWLLIEKTRWGSIIRAGTENLKMVNCLGINISLVFTLTFGLAMAIAGLSGVLASPMRGIEPFMGDLILGICFATVIIGGMGSFLGAVLGGLIVGLSQSLFALIMPSASIIIIFVVMATIILIKPRGLMGIRD